MQKYFLQSMEIVFRMARLVKRVEGEFLTSIHNFLLWINNLKYRDTCESSWRVFLWRWGKVIKTKLRTPLCWTFVHGGSKLWSKHLFFSTAPLRIYKSASMETGICNPHIKRLWFSDCKSWYSIPTDCKSDGTGMRVSSWRHELTLVGLSKYSYCGVRVLWDFNVYYSFFCNNNGNASLSWSLLVT